MKKGVSLILLVVLVLATFVLAQEEFSVRFHSFGKNATINLKDYLGETEYYLSSQSDNVIVHIDQETGIATLIARQGWEGSEVVFFRTNESFKKLEDEGEIAKFLPSVPEILYMKTIRDAELARLFEGTLDQGMLDIIKEIKREEIKKLSKISEGKISRIRVNDEVDLKMERGYVPTISMDFSLGEKEEVEEKMEEERAIKLKINTNIMIGIAAILAITGIFFYRKHAKIETIKRINKELNYTISKDIKQLSLNKLQKLQKELDKGGSSDKFIKIVREFFSRYFGVEYGFEFNYLIRRVRDSDINGHMKKEIKNFLNDLSKIIYYPTEKWTNAYGKGHILKKELKRFVIRMKRIIQKL